MAELAELIFVWGMGVAILVIPTGLLVVWSLCRSPSSPSETGRTPMARGPANDSRRGSALDRAA